MKAHAIFITLALSLSALIGGAPNVLARELNLPLDLSGTRPAVLVSVGGGPGELWIFDTGAGGSVVDIARAQAWALPNQGPALIGSPAGGTPVEGFRTNVSGATVGGASLPNFAAVAMPLPPHLERAGVLSPNMFLGQLVTLDFARTELRVTDRNAASLPSGEATPYSGAGHHRLPSIAVALAGHTHMAHLDTGAPRGILFPYSMAASLPLTEPPVRNGVARFVDGEHARYSARVRGEVTVGPLTLTDPEVEFVEGLPTVNVGMDLLRQLTITLDPEAQLVWATSSDS